MWKSKNKLNQYTTVGTLILAKCVHEDDSYFIEGQDRLTTYGAHCEGLSHVEDGMHVLVYGGELYDIGEMGEHLGYIPNTWFLNGSDFEVVANPVEFIPIEEFD